MKRALVAVSLLAVATPALAHHWHGGGWNRWDHWGGGWGGGFARHWYAGPNYGYGYLRPPAYNPYPYPEYQPYYRPPYPYGYNQAPSYVLPPTAPEVEVVPPPPPPPPIVNNYYPPPPDPYLESQRIEAKKARFFATLGMIQNALGVLAEIAASAGHHGYASPPRGLHEYHDEESLK
jgi:hypothetical protein